MTMTMKKFFGMLTAMVMTAMTFTSCYDEDVDTSITLSGDWYGNFGMYYDYYDRYGNYVATYDSYDTDISFYPDYNYATHGYGYQVDYYKRGPYKKVYHSFHWEVRNQNIYLEYCHDSEYDTVIRDYRMTRSYFSGYFDNGSERFQLDKYADYYDWNPYWNDYGDYYHNGWGYYYYDEYYYAPTRAAAADSIDVLDGGSVRFGNRMK